jgi:hypothetical protein
MHDSSSLSSSVLPRPHARNGVGRVRLAAAGMIPFGSCNVLPCNPPPKYRSPLKTRRRACIVAALLWLAATATGAGAAAARDKTASSAARDWCSAHCPDAARPDVQQEDDLNGAKHAAIVGCQKCGTTFLHAWLAGHPSIVAASARAEVRQSTTGLQPSLRRAVRVRAGASSQCAIPTRGARSRKRCTTWTSPVRRASAGAGTSSTGRTGCLARQRRSGRPSTCSMQRPPTCSTPAQRAGVPGPTNWSLASGCCCMRRPARGKQQAALPARRSRARAWVPADARPG